MLSILRSLLFYRHDMSGSVDALLVGCIMHRLC